MEAGKAGTNIHAAANRTRGLAPVPVLALIPLSLFIFLPAYAGAPVRFAGAVSGLVTNSSGKPQSGATVALFNQQAKLLQRAYTDLAGNFTFGDLLPDLYSVQVTQATFVPATRDRVQVKPGMRSLLDVNLSRAFSSIQVVSAVPVPGGLMDEDWKWTLRSDSSLRPVLRLLPSAPRTASAQTSVSGNSRTAVFHDSTGMVKISATDSALTDAATDEADLGTQFAFATSVYSNTQVRVSGDVGYASATGAPGAAIRTTLSRDIAGDSPTVSLTMRQMSVPSRVSEALMGGPAGEGNLPTLRTLSISMHDQAQLGDSLSLVYGTELDTISFLNRMQYFSPWAKLSYALPNGRFDLIFSSGNAQRNLGSVDNGPAFSGDGLQSELAALSVVPRLSQLGGQVKVQRGDNYEVGYSRTAGAMEYRLSAYHQYVSNATLTVANPDATTFAADLLPSMFASSAFFDAGNVSTSGFTVSATRNISPDSRVTVAYGTIGIMTPDSDGASITDAAMLRQAISASSRRSVTVRASGTVRRTGTRYTASYQYADLQSAVPMASFSTQPDRAEPGLNIAIRQPIPFFFGSMGHVEATADMRNMLAQGYLPLALSGGNQILIVNNPRVFRGGLAFIF